MKAMKTPYVLRILLLAAFLAAGGVIGAVSTAPAAAAGDPTAGGAAADHMLTDAPAAEPFRAGAVTQALHIGWPAQKNGDGPGSGVYLNHILKITGDLLPEEVILRLSELEALWTFEELDLRAAARTDVPTRTAAHEYAGLDLFSLLDLCGLPQETNLDAAQLRFFIRGGEDSPAFSCSASDLRRDDGQALLVFSSDGAPLVEAQSDLGYTAGAENDGGPLSLLAKTTDGWARIPHLSKILVLSSETAADPRYGLHNRPPHDELREIPFTIQVFQESDAEAPRLIRDVRYRMDDIEQMMMKTPEAAASGLYGTIGTESSKKTMGLGGYIDYFEGLKLSWLLFEKTGVPRGDGYVKLYGRTDVQYATIPALRYFDPPGGDFSAYRIEMDEEYGVSGFLPILAPSKNGMPLLQEHEHESSGYVNYNQLNARLQQKGVDSAIGLVKNHSGPFVAGLPNLEGVYGGYQQETGGDCVRMAVYLRPPAETWSAEVLQFLSDEAATPQGQSRSAFIQTLWEWCGAPAAVETETFSDVPPQASYGDALTWACGNQLVLGVGNHCFAPDRSIRSEEIALILERIRQQQQGE
jgi:hypothetical protein